MGRWIVALCTMLAVVLSVARGASAAAPLRCLAPEADPAGALGPPITDALASTDPTHRGRLQESVPAVPSTCGGSKQTPAAVETESRFPYRVYRFVNRSRTASCVGVSARFFEQTVTPLPDGDGGVGFHQMAAYLGAFEPNDVRAGYLGDPGSRDGGPDITYFTFTVPPLAPFEVVVSWTGPLTPGYEPNYELFVGGCGQLVATSVSPASAGIEGETLVTIKGSGFEAQLR